MADIGATLREARMRQRIDITDMEARTKIRAKYLRALENEEWDLLPGPTYVRSFLRTYAEALGLDAKMLVEDFKLRHDPLETGELHPIRRPNQRERDRQRKRQARSGVPRAGILVVVLLGIFAALYLVGQRGGDDEDPEGLANSPAQTEPKGEDAGGGSDDKTSTTKKKPKASRPKVVRLQLVATGQVYACLVDKRGKVLLRNQLLSGGDKTETFRSQQFRLVLGNNNVTLRINGTNRTVPASSSAIGYTITPKGRSELPAERQPSCEA